MTQEDQPTMIRAELPFSILASDLDGTLIPLDGNAENRRDLRTIGEHFASGSGQLVFVTGRHLESVQQAIEQHALPEPHWIICDVGTRVCQRDAEGTYRSVQAYEQQLSSIMQGMAMTDIAARLADLPALRLQEPFKQGPFKLSYYTAADTLGATADHVGSRIADLPLSMISSVDPFNNDGLIDLLPAGVSKAYALQWWSEHIGQSADQIVFAGDSGNDLAALTAGYAAIVVGNAAPSLVDAVRESHQRSGWSDRLYIASRPASSGVLQGCQHFGLFH